MNAGDETPPRMWRKHIIDNPIINIVRNTSTYVEKTSACCLRIAVRRKHLHVCGENRIDYDDLFNEVETPPRMWRKLKRIVGHSNSSGNTSTYVEKTSPVQSVRGR